MTSTLINELTLLREAARRGAGGISRGGRHVRGALQMIGVLTFPIKLGLIGLFLYTLGGGFLVFSPAQFIGGL